MADRVRIERSGGVAEVTLDRPDKGNALDWPMVEALTAAGEALAGETDLRAVVLTGAGAHFCTGIDLALLKGGLMDNARFRAQSGPVEGKAGNPFQRPAQVWRDLPVPVIAAIRGVAYGGGAQIALGADIRIAAPDARLSIMEIRWGLVPDMGLMATLPRLVRIDVAKELVLTGRVARLWRPAIRSSRRRARPAAPDRSHADAPAALARPGGDAIMPSGSRGLRPALRRQAAGAPSRRRGRAAPAGLAPLPPPERGGG